MNDYTKVEFADRFDAIDVLDNLNNGEEVLLNLEQLIKFCTRMGVEGIETDDMLIERDGFYYLIKLSGEN